MAKTKKNKGVPRNPLPDADWVKFTDGRFQLNTGTACRFLYKEPKSDQSILHTGEVISLFQRNYMTFVKVRDLDDEVERDVMLQSIYEVNIGKPA